MTREEAINIVRNIYQTDAEREVLAILIPELKVSENENERIREEIIEYLKLHDKGENDYAHAMFSKWFNWLEKQKGMDNSYTNVIFPFKAMVKENGKIVTILNGQLSSDCKYWEKYQSSSEDGFKVYNPDEIINIKEMLSYPEKQKDYRKLYENIAKSEWFKKAYEGKPLGCDYEQKEQNPVEYEKPLLSKFEQAVYDCAWSKVTCKPEGETQEEYAKRWAGHLLLMVRDWVDDYIDSQIESAKRKAYDRGKTDAEKPAGWSEEDEAKKERLISIVKRALQENKYPLLNYDGAAELIDWIKSLRPQSKQELSDEDEEMLNTIIADVSRTLHSCGIGTDEHQIRSKAIRFLRSLRPSWKPIEVCYGVKGDPDDAGVWKPSKEQMDVLKDILKNYSYEAKS